MSNGRTLTVIVLVIAIGLSMYVLFGQERTKQIGIEPGMVAPDVTLPVWGSDEPVALSSYRGDIVVVNMWASWCPPCQKEMPALDRFFKDYADKGVTVVGINMHTFERTASDREEFIEEFNVSFPTWIDEEGEVAERYQIQFLPTTFILDEEGVIEHVVEGEVNYEMLADFMSRMIEEE